MELVDLLLGDVGILFTEGDLGADDGEKYLEKSFFFLEGKVGEVKFEDFLLETRGEN